MCEENESFEITRTANQTQLSDVYIEVLVSKFIVQYHLLKQDI